MSKLLHEIEYIPGKPYAVFECSACSSVRSVKKDQYNYDGINLCHLCDEESPLHDGHKKAYGKEYEKNKKKIQELKNRKKEVPKKLSHYEKKLQAKRAKEEQRKKIAEIFKVPVNPQKCRYHQFK